MIIRAIRLGNLGLYSGQQVVEPVTGRNGQGTITLIGGLNGRGKTTLLEAILLALYGSRSPVIRGRGSSYASYLQELVHRGTSDTEGCFVELDLELAAEGESTRLRVRRSWPAAHGESPDHLTIWRLSPRDGHRVKDDHLANNWSTYVEEVVPSGVSELFFFDGEKIAAIAEAEETTDSLRAAIRSLLGLDLVERLIGDLSILIRRQKTKIQSVEGADAVAQLDERIEELIRTRRRLHQELGEQTNRVDRKGEELRQKEQQYLETGGTLALNREQLQREQAELQNRSARLKDNLVDLAAGAMPLLLVLPLLRDVWAHGQVEQQVQQARLFLPLLDERDNRLIEHLRQNGFDGELLDTLAAFLANDRGPLEEISRRDQPSFSLSATARAQLFSLLTSDQHELGQQSAQLLSAYEQSEQSLYLIQQHLMFRVDDRALSQDLRDLATVAKELADLQHQRDRTQREHDMIEHQIEKLENERRAALASVLDKLDSLDDSKRTIDLALRSQELQLKFARIVAENKIANLGRSIRESFSSLTHKAELVSEVRIDPTDFRILLFDNAGREIPKARLSSGEKQMLAVAILWGLARASGWELPVIIDTPMGRLDSSHRLTFVERYLPYASHQVLVLSTDTEIIGPYLEALNGAVGERYVLRYDEDLKRTTVESGYFSVEEGVVA